MNRITGGTRICGIIGDPVEHSMSPVMHNAAFEALGINYAYLPFRVRREGLKAAISGMRALNIAGLNVTIPHKMAVIPFLDKLDLLAGRMGAVNTIANENGELAGYNTDASGFLQALRARGVESDGKRVVILGAGGAAKGISFILAEEGASLVILNRTLYRAKELASQIAQDCQRKIEAMTLNETNLKRAFDRADILVNTTSILIAHRLSTVKAADRIIVIDHGQIIEEGDHDHLLQRGGHYADLYNTYFRHQSLSYVTDRSWLVTDPQFVDGD